MRRWIVRVVVLLLVTTVLLELALRVLLFAPQEVAQSAGHRLRYANLYTHRSRNEYWKLQWLLADPDYRRPPPRFDAYVGWVPEEVEPGTYVHDDAKDLGARRPVLLFGDSFAECKTDAADCW